MLQSDNFHKIVKRIFSSKGGLCWSMAGALLLFCSCNSGSGSEQDENNVGTGSGGTSAAGVPGGIGQSGGTLATGGSVTTPTGGTVTTPTAGTATTPTGGTELTGGAGDIPLDGGSGNDGGGDIQTETDGATADVSNGGTGGTDTSTGGDGGSISPDHCLAGITSYNADGPFTYDSARSGAVNMYVPDVPAGCKVPMVHLANGTGGNCMFYATILGRLASNGFLALCYENTNTGAGTFGIDAYKAALAEYPDLADLRFGSTGHSQGGMAAFNTLAYAEKEWGDQGIYAALPMEPASGFGANPREGWQTLYAGIKSPVFMFSGLGTDTLVSQGWVQDAFNTLDDSTEAYFYAKSGANHIGTIGRDGAEVVISWFRWKLLGDAQACEYFKALPTTDSTWSLVDSQNEKQCN